MKVLKFDDCEKLVPLKHSVLGDIYIPELSRFELEHYTSTIAPHSIAVAENLFADSRQIDELLPLSPAFNYDKSNKNIVAVWQGRRNPENLYEEKLLGKSILTFTQITLTMFLCDKDGNCICPFDERFGEIKMQRLRLFGKFIEDIDAVNNFNKIILGMDSIDEEQKNDENSKKSNLSVSKKKK